MAALGSRASLLPPSQTLREDQLPGGSPRRHAAAHCTRACLLSSKPAAPLPLRSAAAGSSRAHPRRRWALEERPKTRGGVNVRSVAESVPGQAEVAGDSQERKQELKLKVLRTVAGLDRGVAASGAEVQRVLEAVEALEAEASLRSFQEGPLPDTPPSNPASASPGQSPFGLEAMEGLWRLVFSSGFAAGSLGGLRPGPPTGRLPILVGQVLQRIDMSTRTLDNIVELRLGVLPWPLPSVEVTATLAHTFEALGTSTIRITFEKTSVKAGDFGSDSPLPSLSTPEIPEFLRPPSPARSGQFETTYLDNDFRVSRGDLGELRIFVRA